MGYSQPKPLGTVMTNLPSHTAQGTSRPRWQWYLLVAAYYSLMSLPFLLLLYVGYFLAKDEIPNWKVAWALLSNSGFGFSNLSRSDAAYLGINARYLLWNAVIFAAAFPCYWAYARLSRRDPAMRLQQLERNRPFQAVVLLSFAFGFMPFTLFTFLAYTVQVQQGLLSGESGFFGSIFSGLCGPALMFLIVSGFFHGTRSDIENDELIRQQRGKAVQAGYWAMLAGGAIIGLGVMVSPVWQMAALPLVLYLGLAVAMVHFAIFLLRSGGTAEA